MKRLFGKFGFRQLSYDRPNQQWICGRACEGKECPYGPDLRGDCQASHECSPTLKDERWVCNRTRAGSDLQACEEGPTPKGECCRPIPKCTPVRSLRSRRVITTLLVTALSIGALLLLLTNSEYGTPYMTPGKLTHAHSSAQSKCNDCHVAGAGIPLDWIHALGGETAAPDSQRCLICHPLGEQPMNPHSLPLQALAESRSRILAAASGTQHRAPTGLQLAALGFAPDNIGGDEMRCSACHVEHQGKDHDLKKLSNARCQVCHAVQFKSFAHGHPPFGDYPFTKRTQIVFDHERHLNLHFKEKADTAPTSCLDCHTMDERGELMMVKGFEQSCARCHANDFSGFDAKAPAIAFLRIPLMDIEGFEEGELKVGEWPDDWDSLGTTLTPFTEFLLQDKFDHRHAVHRMADKDLDIIAEEDWQAGYNLAWGIKELMYDLSEKGMPEIERRIAAALERPLTTAEKTSLTQTIAPDIFKTTARHWFPKLTDEVTQHLAGESPAAAFMDLDGMEERLSIEAVALGGNWIRSDTDLTIYYRPSHHADPFMKIWLSLAAKGAGGSGTNSIARLSRHLSGNSLQVAPGRCMKCHTPDREDEINWTGLRPDHTRHSFSHFSHQAHFSLLDERGCVTCHRIEYQTPEKPYLGSFAYHREEDASGFISNFKSIEQATCAACHTKSMAGESCLTCHNYHIGIFQTTQLKSGTFEHIQATAEPAPKAQ